MICPECERTMYERPTAKGVIIACTCGYREIVDVWDDDEPDEPEAQMALEATERHLGATKLPIGHPE